MEEFSGIKNTPLFFIIGRPRSGTTLLRHLLDAHPNVIIPEECNFLLTLSLAYKNVKKFDAKLTRKFLKDLRGAKKFKTLPLDYKALEQRLYALPNGAGLQQMFSAIHFSCLSIHKKEEIIIRGDKNPAYSSELFHKLIQSFPDAKYIHLIRDYHDHIASILTGKMVMPSPAYMAIAWKKSIRRLERYKQKRVSGFFTIRYEDLAVQPEENMKKICNFLQIPYDPQMFDFYTKKEEYLNHQPKADYANNHLSLFNPVNTGRIGKWRDVLKGDELAVTEIISGKTGKEYGYDYSGHKLNVKIVYLLLKWHFYYHLVRIIRAFVFLLPLNKRYDIVGRLKKNKAVLSIYHSIIRRKP